MALTVALAAAAGGQVGVELLRCGLDGGTVPAVSGGGQVGVKLLRCGPDEEERCTAPRTPATAGGGVGGCTTCFFTPLSISPTSLACFEYSAKLYFILRIML